MLRIFYKRQIAVVVSPDGDIACCSNLGMVYSALKEEEEEEQLDKILCLKKKINLCHKRLLHFLTRNTESFREL